MERAYLAMKNSGAGSIAIGIVLIVVGVTAGVLSIVSGANLLRHKREITFLRQSISAGLEDRSLWSVLCRLIFRETLLGGVFPEKQPDD